MRTNKYNGRQAPSNISLILIEHAAEGLGTTPYWVRQQSARAASRKSLTARSISSAKIF
jgi:hypothetical protein